MSNFDGVLNPAAGWPDIPQASTSMVVLGGAGGPLNEQATQLAARTNKLKEDIENIPSVGFGGTYHDLSIVVSGIGYQGAITSDRIVVESEDFTCKLLRGVSLSFDGANSGVNGIDTGTVAAGNWYYLHVIYNSTTDTIASLISLSATAPALPSGYTMKSRVGAAYVAPAASTFYRQKQNGNAVMFLDSSGDKAANWAITPGQSVSNPQLINNALIFPPTAVSAEVTMTSDSTTWSALHSSSSLLLTSRMMFVLGGYVPAATGNISVVGNPNLYYHSVGGNASSISYVGSYGYTDNI